MSAVPILRFKEHQSSWKKTVLGEIANFRRGSFPQPYGLPKWYDDENGYPFVQVFDVDRNFKLKPNTKRMISELATAQSVFVKKNSIVLTIQGSIGRIAITQYDAYVDRTLLIFQSFNQPLNEQFFAYVIFLLFEKEKKLAPGGTIKTITKEVLSSFKFLFPPLPEQKKIADFLGAVDDKIAGLRERERLLTQYKKGVMQKILTQTLRFKADDGSDFPEWEKSTLGKTRDEAQRYSFTGGPFGSDLKQSHYKDSGIPVIQLQNIGDGAYREKTAKTVFVSDADADRLHACNIFPGDIILSKMGDPVARACLIPETYKRYVMCSDGIRLVVDLSKFSKEFVFQYTLSYHFRKDASSQSIGSTRRRISLGDLKNVYVPQPHPAEQQKIADFLSAIDDKITAVSAQITQMQDFKKGLLQQMFV